MLLEKLADKKLIHPPHWLANNTCYLYLGGSQAYGTTQDTEAKVSDWDIGGIAIPPKEQIFPHLAGVIPGFGNQGQRFDEFEQHQVFDADANKEYDIKVYSIVKFFRLAAEGNPNIIDGLFVPQTCILHTTSVGNIIRENRKEFLSKVCWPKYKGYAYGQIKHMANKEPVGKRALRVKQYSYDTKFAMHTVRLLNAVEMILTEGDLDVQRNKEQNKAIRRGEWTEQQVYDYFNKKEAELEKVYSESKLRAKPDEAKLKSILLDCLETHYGSLDKVIVRQDESLVALKEINEIIDKLKAKQVL